MKLPAGISVNFNEWLDPGRIIWSVVIDPFWPKTMPKKLKTKTAE
jgi:hypothetical protein